VAKRLGWVNSGRGGWAPRSPEVPVGVSILCHCSSAARSARLMNAPPRSWLPQTARHAAMGLWEHSGRDLHSHMRDLGFYAVSYSAMPEIAGQDYVYVSEGV